MIYIALGATSFLLTLLFAVISWKKVRGAKIGIWALANVLLIYSVIALCFSPDKLLLPFGTGWLG